MLWCWVSCAQRAKNLFRELLLVRDGDYSLLNTIYGPDKGEAAHVVPQSRPDVGLVRASLPVLLMTDL